MIGTVFRIALLGVVLCDESSEQEAKLRFYYSDFAKYTELPITDSTQVLSTEWYNSTRKTVIFTHGFNGYPEGPAITAVIKEHIKLNDTNVVLLNWDHLAAPIRPNMMINSYFNWAAPNARLLGLRFADTLLNLSSAGLDLARTHLIGHSLGAQLFGVAANQLLLSGVQLPWIIGLDPAGPGFENRPIQQRLNPNSAGFVSVIHTDPSGPYGFSKPLGTVDFWPNYRNVGPIRQPGCPAGPHPMFSPEDMCNHNRSWQLLVDAIRHPGTLLASYAKNFRTWKNYSAEEAKKVVCDIGLYNSKVVPGNYYLITKDASPFGLSMKGLQIKSIIKI